MKQSVKSDKKSKQGFKNRPLSKKKQKQKAKSAQDMISKMDAHTTADDIFNIVKSVEDGIDTKAVDGEETTGSDNLASSLINLKDDIKKDEITKEKNEIKQQKEKAELDAQLKLIEDFNL